MVGRNIRENVGDCADLKVNLATILGRIDVLLENEYNTLARSTGRNHPKNKPAPTLKCSARIRI
jgi:hypothetical protein